LVLLGFTACDKEPGRLEYGSPYSRFEIKGKVQNEQQLPVNNAKIIVKEVIQRGGVEIDSYPIDNVSTQANGEYQYAGNYTASDATLRVVCEDPSNVYEADSVDVLMEPEGGKGWYKGEDTAEVNFTLTKKHE
jgi:putative lipoprotein (rSAM/lipoprotein system)